MSDQTSGPADEKPPFSPPPQATEGSTPSPAPMTEPAAAPMTEPAPIKKKPRLGMWIAIAILIGLLLCGVVSAAGYFTLVMPAMVADAYRRADVAYVVPFRAMQGYMLPPEGGSADPEKFFATQRERAAATRRGIAAARAILADLPDSAAKRDYVAALGKVDDALARLVKLDEEQTNFPQIVKDLTGRVEALGRVDAIREAAITAGDSRDWTTAISKAKIALVAYGLVQKQLDDMDQRHPEVGISTLTDYIDLRIKMSEKALDMYTAEQDGDTSKGSQLIDEYNKMNHDLNGTDDPALITDPSGTAIANWADAMTAVGDDLVSASMKVAVAYERVKIGK